jgi:hypothetical protein
MGTYKTVFGRDNDLVVTDSSGSTTLVITSTGGVYSRGVPLNYIETLTGTTANVWTPSTIPAYGVSVIPYSAATTSPGTITVGVPIPGVTKTIVMKGSTAAWEPPSIYLGSGITVLGSTATTPEYLLFSTVANESQGITLVGISTAMWAVQCICSTVGTFGTANGIIGSSIARTS